MQLFQSEAGQKAEAANVDRQDWDSTRGGEMGGGEHGAVAAEYEQKLRRVSYALARLPLRSAWQRTSGFLVNESLYAARSEPFQQWRDNHSRSPTARARK